MGSFVWRMLLGILFYLFCTSPSYGHGHSYLTSYIGSPYFWNRRPGPIPGNQQPCQPDLATAFQTPGRRQPLKQACLAGYDDQIFKLMDEIRIEGPGSEIEVYFYFFRNCKFFLFASHVTDLSTMQKVLAKYNHYFCLSNNFMGKLADDNHWDMQNFIVVPNKVEDTSSFVQDGFQYPEKHHHKGDEQINDKDFRQYLINIADWLKSYEANINTFAENTCSKCRKIPKLCIRDLWNNPWKVLCSNCFLMNKINKYISNPCDACENSPCGEFIKKYICTNPLFKSETPYFIYDKKNENKPGDTVNNYNFIRPNNVQTNSKTLSMPYAPDINHFTLTYRAPYLRDPYLPFNQFSSKNIPTPYEINVWRKQIQFPWNQVMCAQKEIHPMYVKSWKGFHPKNVQNIDILSDILDKEHLPAQVPTNNVGIFNIPETNSNQYLINRNIKHATHYNTVALNLFRKGFGVSLPCKQVQNFPVYETNDMVQVIKTTTNHLDKNKQSPVKYYKAKEITRPFVFPSIYNTFPIKQQCLANVYPSYVTLKSNIPSKRISPYIVTLHSKYKSMPNDKIIFTNDKFQRNIYSNTLNSPPNENLLLNHKNVYSTVPNIFKMYPLNHYGQILNQPIYLNKKAAVALSNPNDNSNYQSFFSALPNTVRQQNVDPIIGTIQAEAGEKPFQYFYKPKYNINFQTMPNQSKVYPNYETAPLYIPDQKQQNPFVITFDSYLKYIQNNNKIPTNIQSQRSEDSNLMTLRQNAGVQLQYDPITRQNQLNPTIPQYMTNYFRIENVYSKYLPTTEQVQVNPTVQTSYYKYQNIPKYGMNVLKRPCLNKVNPDNVNLPVNMLSEQQLDPFINSFDEKRKYIPNSDTIKNLNNNQADVKENHVNLLPGISTKYLNPFMLNSPPHNEAFKENTYSNYFEYSPNPNSPNTNQNRPLYSLKLTQWPYQNQYGFKLSQIPFYDKKLYPSYQRRPNQQQFKAIISKDIPIINLPMKDTVYRNYVRLEKTLPAVPNFSTSPQPSSITKPYFYQYTPKPDGGRNNDQLLQNNFSTLVVSRPKPTRSLPLNINPNSPVNQLQNGKNQNQRKNHPIVNVNSNYATIPLNVPSLKGLRLKYREINRDPYQIIDSRTYNTKLNIPKNMLAKYGNYPLNLQGKQGNLRFNTWTANDPHQNQYFYFTKYDDVGSDIPYYQIDNFNNLNLLQYLPWYNRLKPNIIPLFKNRLFTSHSSVPSIIPIPKISMQENVPVLSSTITPPIGNQVNQAITQHGYQKQKPQFSSFTIPFQRNRYSNYIPSRPVLSTLPTTKANQYYPTVSHIPFETRIFRMNDGVNGFHRNLYTKYERQPAKIPTAYTKYDASNGNQPHNTEPHDISKYDSISKNNAYLGTAGSETYRTKLSPPNFMIPRKNPYQMQYLTSHTTSYNPQTGNIWNDKIKPKYYSTVNAPYQNQFVPKYYTTDRSEPFQNIALTKLDTATSAPTPNSSYQTYVTFPSKQPMFNYIRPQYDIQKRKYLTTTSNPSQNIGYPFNGLVSQIKRPAIQRYDPEVSSKNASTPFEYFVGLPNQKQRNIFNDAFTENNAQFPSKYFQSLLGYGSLYNSQANANSISNIYSTEKPKENNNKNQKPFITHLNLNAETLNNNIACKDKYINTPAIKDDATDFKGNINRLETNSNNPDQPTFFYDKGVIPNKHNIYPYISKTKSLININPWDDINQNYNLDPITPIPPNYMQFDNRTNVSSTDMIKRNLYQYLNSQNNKENIFDSNSEITIRIGDLGIVKYVSTDDPSKDTFYVKTSDPNINLKAWSSKLKYVTAKIVLENHEQEALHFAPIIKNCNEYNPVKIQMIAKEAISKVYGEPIIILGTYSTSQPYAIVNNLNELKISGNKICVLWPTYCECGCGKCGCMCQWRKT